MVLLFARNQGRPRTVVGGRLVEPPARSVSLQRLGVVLLIMGLLYTMNQRLRLPSRRHTDFALWSLSEPSSDRVRIHVATMTMDCPYRVDVVGPVCALLRDQLAHGQPPFYDENDYPYTVHRILCWTLFLASLLNWCCKNRSKARLHRNVLLDAMLDLVLMPIDSALQLIGLLSFILYPTWMRMQTLILLQHQNSWFHDSFALSVSCLVLLALVGNLLSRNIWNTTLHRSCQLGRLAPAPAHALVAAAAGYYRGSFASEAFLAATPSHSFYGSTYYSPTTMNWMLFCLVIASVAPRQRAFGVGVILSWVLTNTLAALFGQYQQEQQVLPVLANTISNAWREFWHSLTQP